MLCNMYTYSYLSGAVNRFAGIYPLPTTSYHQPGSSRSPGECFSQVGHHALSGTAIFEKSVKCLYIHFSIKYK